MSKSKTKGESLPISKLVRILLPEIQVLDHIKENGVINKEHFKKNKKVLNNTITNTKRDIGKKINSNINSTERSVQNISIKSNDINSDKLITNNYAKANNNVQKQALDQLFDRVESTLSDYVLGQKEYLPKLTIAFKRPFVYGKKDGISNTIFITGPKGSGKHLSVKAITRFLKEQKLIKGNGVYQIDLSKYKLEKDAENLFLTDIYNALYGSESVVVFDKNKFSARSEEHTSELQ